MTNRYYISDTHFHHANIITYANRPFRSVAEMHECLLDLWNEVVKPNDHISHLGDVSILRGGKNNQDVFIQLIKKLNGHKRLYLGNHDHFPMQVYLDAGFEKVYATWRTGENIVFSHIPLHPQSLGSAIANVHGHIHDNPDHEPALVGDKVKPYVNICVEKIGYKPIHIDEILAIINNKVRAYGEGAQV